LCGGTKLLRVLGRLEANEAHATHVQHRARVSLEMRITCKLQIRTVVLEENMAFTPPTIAEAHSPSRIPAMTQCLQSRDQWTHHHLVRLMALICHFPTESKVHIHLRFPWPYIQPTFCRSSSLVLASGLLCSYTEGLIAYADRSEKR
jgi:hypothetical protein